MARRKFAYMVIDYLPEYVLGKEPPFWKWKEWKKYWARVREIGFNLAPLNDKEMYERLVAYYSVEDSKSRAFVEESRSFRKAYIAANTLDDIINEKLEPVLREIEKELESKRIL